jgi:hypothetical protein
MNITRKWKRIVASGHTEIVAIVSDLHCGSEVGLAHPESELESGNVIGFGNNVIQQWLWACWQDGCERIEKIAGKDKFALIVNGDATEGVHHGGAQIIAQKITEHVGIAVKCLTPLAKRAAKTFVVKGTECHTRDMESLLAKELGAESGEAKDSWRIRINGTLIDARHHMPTSSRRYLEAGALSITLGNARLNCVDAGHEAPKVLARGHRHCGGWYSNGHAAIGVTGGFQMLTRHGFKVVGESIPHPSLLVLDWRGLPPGSLPREYLIKYDPPQQKAVVI